MRERKKESEAKSNSSKRQTDEPGGKEEEREKRNETVEKKGETERENERERKRGEEVRERYKRMANKSDRVQKDDEGREEVSKSTVRNARTERILRNSEHRVNVRFE